MFTQSIQTAAHIDPPPEVNLITASSAICSSTLMTSSNNNTGFVGDNGDEVGTNLISVDSILLLPLAPCMSQYETPSLYQSDSMTSNMTTAVAHSSSSSSSLEKLKLVGRWGEALVYHHLVTSAAAVVNNKNATSIIINDSEHATCDGSKSNNHGNNSSFSVTVEWMNQDAETKACYDIIVTRIDKRTGRAHRQYIEVKSTRYSDNNVFEISLREYEFAMGLPRVQYSIYRVFNAGDIGKTRIVIIPDLYSFITQQRVKLCIAL